MTKSIHDLVQDRFGVRTRTVLDPEAVSSVGAAITLLLRANPRRVAFTLQNLHATQTLYVSPDSAPSTTRGIVVPPQASLAVTVEEDFTLPAMEWYGIASGAGTNVFIQSVEIETD